MKYLSLLLAVVLVSVCSAQQPVVRLEADATIFRYDSTRQLWEWSYSFPDTALTYKQRDGQGVGEMYFRIAIRDTAGALVKNEEWIVANTAATAGDTNVRNLIGVKQFVLAPGTYQVECVAADMANRQDSLHRSFSIGIPKPVTNKLAVSGIQLPSSINPAAPGANPVYSKGGMTVVPNPSAQYIIPKMGEDEFNPGLLLPYYFEVYNAKTLSPSGIAVQFTVLDAKGASVISFTQKYNVPADGFAVYGNLPLDTLASDSYYFTVRVAGTEGAAGDSILSMKRFEVYNPAKPPVEQPVSLSYVESLDFEMSEFTTMSKERIREEYEKITPLLTPHERDGYQLLTEEIAQRRFLYRYWKNQDPDPETPENEARQDFEERINYANKYFSTMQTQQGWRTDRGRILRQYGKPDKVDVSPYSTEAKPYAVWSYYYVQGGVQFCFVELNGLDYKLVHSTARNELSEPQWYKRYAEIMGAAQFHR